MKVYEIFKSEGGYRFAGAIWAGGPVVENSPWFARVADAKKAAEKQRETDKKWLSDELECLGLAECDLLEN